jgi:MFS family permease
LNGISFHVAEAFISETTILPSFISNLTSSKLLIGLAGSLRRATWPLPQAIVAGYLENRNEKLPVYQGAAILRILAMIALTIITFLFGSNTHLLLLLFFALFAFYSLSAGIAGLPFMDIVARSIPTTRRGSYFGARYSFGTLFGALAGFFIVRRILQKFTFPENYGTLFLFATLFIALGVILFSLVIEPSHTVVKKKRSFVKNLSRGKRFLAEDRNYRNLYLTRILLGVGMMSFPFYFLYTRKVWETQEEIVGILLSAEMIGALLTNILWGYLSNRRGNKIVLNGAALTSILIPLSAFSLPFLPFETYHPALFIFFLIGSVKSGIWIGYPNFLIDISPESRRPTYIGFMNTLVAPILFLPTLGGGIVDLFSFEILFTISFFAFCFAFIIATRLKEPREQNLKSEVQSPTSAVIEEEK